MTKAIPSHVKIGDDVFRIDENADVPFRRISNSLMVPRQDISGVPGAINLQRDVWLWSMSDFVGGEGRLVFDSSDPIGPPTFYKSDGGIDVRRRGEFSLHPDEKLIANETGGGSAPTKTTWTNTDFTTVAGSPEYNVGAASNHVRLHPSDKIQSVARTPGTDTVVVQVRFVSTKTTKSNKGCDVKLVIRNMTDSTNVDSKTKTLRDNEPVEMVIEFTGTAGKTYRYWVENNDGGTGVHSEVKFVSEYRYTSAPSASQDVRDLRLGVGDDIWATTWDGTGTDVLLWDFGTSAWTQAVGNIDTSVTRAMTGSDQYQYILLANGRVYRISPNGTATRYTQDPATAGHAGNHGEPLGIATAANRLYVLFQQGLFEVELDSSGTLPIGDDPADVDSRYVRVAAPGEFYKEANPDATLREHLSAISNGVRFFTNVRGEQATIWEYSDQALQSPHFLPAGYIITAMRHYANITFIAAYFTNQAASPAETRAGIFYISSDDLLRFLGYLRFDDTNSQPVSYITAYGHDVYFLQGGRIWRYNLGTGGLTLENVVSCYDESKARALARMDKKFWAAYEGEGTYIADDSYPTTTMWMTSPIWDYDVPDLDKVLLSIDLETRPLPSNTRIDVEYNIDESGWTSLGSMTTADDVFTRMTISDAYTTVKCKTLQWRVGLSSLDGADTPRVLAVTVRAYVLEYEDSFDLTVLCDDDDATNRLVSQQLSGRAKAEKLWTYKTTKELIAFEDRYSSKTPGDVDTYTVVVEDPFQEVTEHGQSSIRLKLKVVS